MSPASPFASAGTTITTSSTSNKDEEKPDFELTVSKTPTPHSLYLPKMSDRYKKLEETPNAIIEISPESLSYVSDFAVRIGGANPTSGKTPQASNKESDSFSKAQPDRKSVV